MKDKIIIKMQRIISLKAKVIYLIKYIKNTVKLFVFKQWICVKSKFWWNNELIEMQKTLLSKKWIWKRCRNDDAWAFFFFIKCMQFMIMTLSRRCIYAKLHVIWSKSLLYIFSLINHINSLHIQALSLNSHHHTFVFLCFFALFAFYSFVSNSHFLIVIQVFFQSTAEISDFWWWVQ